MNNSKTVNPFFLIFSLLCVALIIAYIIGPVPQSLNYHDFADKRSLWGIPNVWNIMSSAFILLVAGYYFQWILPKNETHPQKFTCAQEYWMYSLFFLSVALAGSGSVYYHLAPSNQRLFWERLPTAVAMMSILSAVFMERITIRLATLLSLAAIALGIWSVIYWDQTEALGKGDLRLYGLVNILPMLLVPAMLWFYPPVFTYIGNIPIAITFAVLSRVAEVYDKAIYQITGGIISGHTLKHLLMAIAVYYVGRYLCLRWPVTGKKR